MLRAARCGKGWHVTCQCHAVTEFPALPTPSDENDVEIIPLSWPRRGGSIPSPVLASQIRMVLSSDPEMILDPSGENAMDRTESS